MAHSPAPSTSAAPAASSHTSVGMRAGNWLVVRLSRLGVPLGPNVLLTVRGRKSGRLRTTPVAIIEAGGRRFLQSPTGTSAWITNLRAAGEATLTRGRNQEQITATPLSTGEATAFYRDLLPQNIGRTRLSRFMGRRLGLTQLIADPEAAASGHVVFELRARA